MFEKNRKLIVGVCIFVSVIIISSLCLILRENNLCYLEQQRALWNELNSLIPLHYRIDTDKSHYMYSFTQRNIRLEHNLSSMPAFMKNNYEYNQKVNDISKRLTDNNTTLADKATSFSIIIPDTPSPSLPLSGLTEHELEKLTLEGNREASLIIIARKSPPTSSIQTHIVKNSLHINRLVPGQNPEKNFFSHLQQAIIQINDLSSTQKTRSSGDKFSQVNYKNLPGYSTFQEKLREGDLLSYLAFKSILSPVTYTMASHDEIMQEEKMLMESLRARSQDKYDLASALLLCRNSPMGFYGMKIDDEFNNRLRIYKQIVMDYPALAGSTIQNIVSFLFFDYSSATSVKKFRQASEALRKAARQGNMEAMFLWLTRGITSLDRFTREDWEEIDTYRKVLLKAGYAPYLETFINKQETLDINLFKSIYPDTTYRSISKRCQKVLEARN